MPAPIHIHWFRQDLRANDNPAFATAANAGCVLPIYILDTTRISPDIPGAASRWWLHHSLNALNHSLHGRLRCYAGDPLKIIPQLARKYEAESIHWNRCYDPWRTRRDTRLKQHLQESEVTVRSHNSALLWEPWETLKKDGTPYRVFTPFYKNGCLKAAPPRLPVPSPANQNMIPNESGANSVEELGLLPNIRWDQKLEPYWNIGESGAQDALQRFIERGLADYAIQRDLPARPNVSRLSPHLHWGEISPHQVWHAIKQHTDAEPFLRQLCWREFSYYLLYHFPEITKAPFNPKFKRFPWNPDTEMLSAWQRGATGIPIVDAGMRELWETGSMHNRVRMIVASFLTKNLRIHWHHGRDWFNDCLVDSDLANNCAGWQWVAGCGADAAPYFRIFNPVTQGQKFDPDGKYTRKYVPELAGLPDKYLFNPWEAPENILQTARVTLGVTYPLPIVDLKISRQQALNAYQTIKG